MLNPNLVAVATIAGQTIYADVSGGLHPAGTTVVLTNQAVSILCPPGWPTRPSLQGVLAGPQTIPAGTTVALLQPEAVAWIAAGAATQIATT